MFLRIGFALLALCILLFVASSLGQRRWRRATMAEVKRLDEGSRPASLPISFSPAELEALPPPVARYLGRVLSPGQRTIRRAVVSWAGEFNMGKPGADRWLPFTATQVYTVNSPGFVWDARITMAPGLPVLVRDASINGQGSMLGKIAGLATVVHRAGTTELAIAALQRHLGEALWFPTALLPSQGVSWEPLDDSRAVASLTSQGTTARAEFRFGPDGRVAAVFVPDRLFDNGKSAPTPYPWQARNLSWRTLHGMETPAESVAEWLLPRGTWAYWRGGPTDIEYTFN